MKLAICYLMSKLTRFANCEQKISVLQNVLASWGDKVRVSPIIQNSLDWYLESVYIQLRVCHSHCMTFKFVKACLGTSSVCGINQCS